MALISTFLVSPSAGELLGDHAVAEHEDARAEREQVALVRRRDDHRQAGGREVGDDLVDRHAGADVDACGRLAQHQDVRADGQAAGQDHLLLVAAAEGRDRGRGSGAHDAEPVAPRLDERRFVPWPRAGPGCRGCAAPTSEMFSPTENSRDDAPRSAGRPGRAGCPSWAACETSCQSSETVGQADCALRVVVRLAREDVRQLERAGAGQARDAEDLARAGLEVDAAQPLAVDPASLRASRAGRPGRRTLGPEVGVDVVADHRAGERPASRARRRRRCPPGARRAGR